MAGLTTAKDVPYFDGDFWPNTLEEAIAEEEKEKNMEELIDTGAVETEVEFDVDFYALFALLRVCSIREKVCSFLQINSVLTVTSKGILLILEIAPVYHKIGKYK